MSANDALENRISFVVELARRLHEYGTAAPRLEDAVNMVAARLALDCNILATPTSIVMSFSEISNPGGLAARTQVLRLPPGDVNLARLCLVDEIADCVTSGKLDLNAGYRRLREIGALPASMLARTMSVVSYGIASASVALILRAGWAGAATAAVIGLLIGATSVSARRRANVAAAFEAASALVATLVAILVAFYLTPISVRLVVIASLIVLLPGMTLTTAVRELSSQHLIAGTARLAGAMATLLKLAFGTVAAIQICALFGVVAESTPSASTPIWIDWIAVPAGAIAFAVAFRTARRHYPIVIASVIMGYLCTRIGGTRISPTFGVFIGGAVAGAASNLFARLTNRPGALVREPGIIMLVPGSVGFSTMNFVLSRDVMIGIDTAVNLITLLVAIVAGLLFGDLLVPPRRKL